MKPWIELEGSKQLRKTLKAAGDDLEGLKEANRQAAGIAAAEARKLVPKRSQALKDTIRTSNASGYAEIKAGYARVPYAGIIHWGTPAGYVRPGWPGGRIKPQPFMTQGAKVTEPIWINVYRQELRKAVSKVKGK